MFSNICQKEKGTNKNEKAEKKTRSENIFDVRIKFICWSIKKQQKHKRHV